MGFEHVHRLDLASGSTSERRRTPQGGLITRANLTRTGVFDYRTEDGSIRRELRPEDEVFHPDSLASYEGAPVTVDHPGRVGPHNWKSVSVGHVPKGAHREGDFVAGEVHLQHQDAIDKAEAGRLTEVSCGYACDLDPTPGEHRGQKYDAIQRNIRINHVALGPKGWGRMGPETRLRLDSNAAVSGEAEGGSYVRDANREDTSMTDEEKKALEKAQADARKANEDLERARQDAKDAKTEGEKLAAQARADAAEIAKLRAENDALKLQIEDGKRTASGDRQRADAKFQSDLEDLIQARADAAMVFATVEDPTGAKYDVRGKTSEQLRMEIIAHLAPKLRLDGIKAIADATVRAEALRPTYETLVGHKRETDKARADAQAAAAGERHEDGAGGMGDDDDDAPPDAAAARKAMIARKKDASKKDKKAPKA